MDLRLKTVVLTALCVLVVSSVHSKASFSFDIDGDGNKDALTDGLLVLRHLFGFSGSTLSEGAVGSDASSMSITSAGVLSFNSAPDYEEPSDYGTNNIYDITVTVSDGTDSVSQDVGVVVLDVNEG